MSEAGKPRRLSAAQRRVLLKARGVGGHIRAAGGYGGTADAGHAEFDQAAIIDRLLPAGLLAFGEHANTYALTEAGLERIRCSRKPPPTAAVAGPVEGALV